MNELLLFFQLNQTSFSFNLSQLQQPQSFSQQNLFLPTTPTQPDPYQPNQVASFARNPQQPYGQTPSQQNMMVSSATTSQMSSAIKAPTQTGFGKCRHGERPSTLVRNFFLFFAYCEIPNIFNVLTHFFEPWPNDWCLLHKLYVVKQLLVYCYFYTFNHMQQFIHFLKRQRWNINISLENTVIKRILDQVVICNGSVSTILL